MDYKKVGLFIKENRTNKGLTQQDLANELFIDVTTVSKWERGITFPDSSLVTKLCYLLGINEHELFLACEDDDYRNAKRSLKKINDAKRLSFMIISGSYLLAILICFICNIAISHKLDWFYIVLVSCLCGWSFCPTCIRYFKKYKLEGFIISTFISLSLLFITCSIFTSNYWCFIAILSVLLFYFLFFFPFIFYKKEYINIPKKYFLLIYSSIALLLTISILVITNLYINIDLLLGLQITIYVSFPVIIASLINMLVSNKYIKSSLIVLETGLFCYGLNYVLNRLLEPSKNNLYKMDFSNWEVCSDGNVSFIVIIATLIISVTLLIIGLTKKYRRK